MQQTIVDAVTQLDLAQEAIAGKDQLYGSITHTSLYDALDEAGAPLDSPATAFVDFGSGTGSVLFYACERYPRVSTFVGVEYDAQLHAMARSRAEQLQLSDQVHLINKDIMTLSSAFLDGLNAEHIVIVSFDTLFPPRVIEHMRSIVDAYSGHVLWLSNQNKDGAQVLRTKWVTGPPGKTEKDPDVEVIVSDRSKSGSSSSNDDDWIVDDDDDDEPFDLREAMRRAEAGEEKPTQMSSFTVYLYEKGQRKRHCLGCGTTNVKYRIGGTPFVVCGRECAKKYY